jgi:hypothetical protein
MLFRIRIAFVIAVCSLALVSAQAPPALGQLPKAEFKCQNTAAKQGKKLLFKTFKALAKCENKVSKGDLPPATDCTADPDAAAKIADAESTYQQKVTDSCTDAVVANLDFGGSCNGVTTVAGLIACGTAEHETASQELIALVYPHNVCASGYRYGVGCVTDADCPASPINPGTCEPANQGLDSDQRKCQKLLGKTVAKEAAKRMGTLQKCKKKVSKGKLPATTNCVTTSATKLADLLTLSREKIAKACPSGLASPQAVAGSCAGESATESVQSCALCTGDREADDLIAVQYGASAVGPTAAAMQISDTADCVGGPLSRCRVNDYLLENDKIRVVIQDVQRNIFGIGQYGGQIIDADLVRASGPDRDNFEEFSLSLNIEATAHYTSITIINDGSDGGPAIIRATGVDDLLDFVNPSAVVAGFGLQFPSSADDLDLPVTVSTDYTLEPGKSYVRVDTTVTNTGGSTLDIFLGEYINGSGQVETFQPGFGFGEPLVTTLCVIPTSPDPPDTPCLRIESLRNFIAYGGHGDADGVSYGYLHEEPQTTTFGTSGVIVPQFGVDIILALLGVAPPPYSILAGDGLTLTRYFAVGENISSITDIRNEIQCKPVGNITGTVTAGGSAADNADVVVLGDLAAATNSLDYNVVTHTRTNIAGLYSLTLPPGDYDIIVNLDGHPYEGGGSTPVLHPVTVVATETATVNVALPATGGIDVTVTDENSADSPAKVSVVGIDPSPEPENTQFIGFTNNRTGVFGDFEDERPFGVANVTFVDTTGSASLTIEPGDYQVVVSRGIEYSTSATNVTVTAAPDPPQAVVAQVEHVLDTTGFVGSDFHVHAIDSPDSETTKIDRVKAFLGEGVDFFTPSEHDIRIDFQSVIDALGASSFLGNAINSEITTFDYGHFNAWPMTIDPAQVNGGSVDHGGAAPDGMDFPSAGNYSLTPAEIIAAAHADPGTDTVQVNHIHSHFGLDGGSGLAIDTGVAPPQSGVPAAAHRLDPVVTNYFSNLPASPADEKFDALEIWIGDSRGQIYDNFLGSINAPARRGGNIGDWFNMINQGILSTGVADSDTHNTFLGVAGFPRSMVASPDDDPADLGAIADTLSANVNAGRVIGTNGPMVRVEVSAISTGQVASLEDGGVTVIATTNGEVSIDVDIQSPEWAEFDTVEYYINTTTKRRTITNLQTGAGTINLNRYGVTPDFTQSVTPSLQPVSGTSSSRWEASDNLTLTGLTEDIWVVVLVKGTDGVSKPLFPVIPNNLQVSGNSTLADLTDGNLGESGITALAFTNPLFVDVDGGGWTAPGLSVVSW